MIHAGQELAQLVPVLSMVELLAVLYGRILRIDPGAARLVRPRPFYILSKGTRLRGPVRCARRNRLLSRRAGWGTFYQKRITLGGATFTHAGVPGVEVSTGSLGHGPFPLRVGWHWLGKRDARTLPRVLPLLSDGECDEGSTWEAMLFAGHHQLDNLVAIIDYKPKYKALAVSPRVLDLNPFRR